MANKKVFTATIDGVEKELACKMPTAAQRKKAEILYAAMFRVYVENKIFVRSGLERHMREAGLWDDEKQKILETLQNAMMEGQSALEKGGIKLAEARLIAINMSKTRRAIAELMREQNELDSMTAEGRANNDRFNYFVSVCTVYNDTGKPVFSSLDNYEENQEEDYASKCANSLAELMYNLDQDFLSNLPENKFLKKYGFIDDKYRFIDKNGKLVNESGDPVDEEGRRLDESGEIIKDEIVEFSPFLDEEGSAVSVG